MLQLRLLQKLKTKSTTINIGLISGGENPNIVPDKASATLDGLGPDGEGIHAGNEHLILSSLIERTSLLTEILRRL